MGKIDSWIPKIPRLKNAKVSRFSYKNAAYTSDDIEGVENYDYTRDMNVPSLNKTDTEASVLDSGARAQFSSLSKNALNHFFGRVSYNLNKVIDFLSDFLDDYVADTTVLVLTTNSTLAVYANKTIKRVYNNSASVITVTFPSGETFYGKQNFILSPYTLIEIQKHGTIWLTDKTPSGNTPSVQRVTSEDGFSCVINSTNTQDAITGVGKRSIFLDYDIYVPSWGTSWETIDMGTTDVFNTIAASSTRLVAANLTTNCYVSDDAGITWVSKVINAAGYIRKVRYIRGFFIAVGTNGACSVSTNNAETWTRKTTGVSVLLTDIIEDGNRIIVIGDNGTCIVSDNDGASWVVKSTGTSYTLRAGIKSLDRICCVGANGTCIVSDTHGDSWVTKSLSSSNEASSLAANNGIITILGSDLIRISVNNGDSWQQRTVPQTQRYLYLVCSIGSRIIAYSNTEQYISDTFGSTWDYTTLSAASPRPNAMVKFGTYLIGVVNQGYCIRSKPTLLLPN